MRIRRTAIALLATTMALGLVAASSSDSDAADYVVYSVYRGVDLGVPGETPEKDYFVNMGTAQGLHPGSVVEVMRRISTYDLLSEKLYKDVTFPIARLKVIHAEDNAAVARLDKMLPIDKTPSLTPRAVMVGDFVRHAQ